MKKIIKKLFIPILFIGLLVFAMTDFNLSGKNKVEAASSDVTIPGSNTSIRIVYTSDLFVAEDFSNELDGIPTSKEFYVTMFVNTTNGINALNAKWNFDASEIDTITAISYANGDEEANINSITGEVSNPFAQTTGSLYASVSRTPSYASYLGSIGHGHTGTSYLEGNGKQLIKDAGLSGQAAITTAGGVNFALSGTNVSINTATNTTYIFAKFKVKLKSTASSFTLKMDTTSGIAIGGNDKTGAGAITGAGCSIFDTSLGAGSLSNKVDTVVTAYKSNQTTTIGTANFSSSITTGSIEVPSGTTTADLGISVDGGKGTITSVTGATLSGSKYVVTNIPAYSATGSATVTINVTSEDGNNTKQYTLTLKQAASSTKTLNSLTISKNIGQNDPIVTTSSSEPTASTSSVTSFTANTQYYVWISAQETGAKVVANYTAQSATLAGTSYSSGATQTVLSATSASFSLVLKAENNDTDSYNFTFKTITDGAKISGATASSGSTQLGTGTPNTSDVIDIEIDYADASGNVYTNPTLQFTLPTNHTELTYNGQTLSSSGLSATYTGLTLSTSTDPNYSAIGTITIVAKDTLTNETKTYTVNVKRRKDTRSDNANLNDLTVSYNGTNVAYTPTLNGPRTYTLTTNIPYTVNALNVKTVLADTTATFTLLSSFAGQSAINGTNNSPTAITIGNSSTITSYTFTITIRVTPQNQNQSDVKVYIISGTRDAAETTNTIDTSLLAVTDTTNNGSSPLSGTWDLAGQYYDLGALPYSVKSLGISAYMTGSFSSMTINGTNATNGQVIPYSIPTSTSAIPQTTIPIVVKSQSNQTKTYYVRYSRNAPDTQNEVTSFTVTADDQTVYSLANGNMTAGSATSTLKKFTMTIPYTVNDVELRIYGVPSLAKAYYDGSQWTDWSTGYKSITIGTASDISQLTKVIKFTITSEANTSLVYEITVTREQANTDTGVTFTVTGDTTGLTINPSAPISGTAQAGHTYYYVKQSQESGVYIAASLVNSNSGTKIMYSTDNGATYTQEYTNQTALSIKSLGATYYFRALPQAGISAAKDYALHIEIADERDDDTTLKIFQLKDDQGNIISPTASSPTFTAGCAPLTLTYEVPYGQGNVTMEVVATKDPKAKVYKDVHDAGATFSCDTSTITAGQSKTFPYYVKAENETYSPAPYQITIKRLQGNSKVGLQTLTVNGQVPYEKGTTTPFSSQLYTSGAIKEYEINLGTSYNGVAANVVANLISNIGNATITTNIAGTLISTKKDSITITATSEDGNVTVIYKIAVYTADDDDALQSFNLLDAESSDIQTTANNTQYANNPHDLMDSSGNQVFNFGAGDSGATATINYANRKVFYEVLCKSTQKLYVKTGNTWTLASTQINNIVTLNVGQNRFVFGVVSELDALKDSNPTPSNIYTFVLTVGQADTENRLATFDAKIGGVQIAASDIIFSPSSNSIIVNNVGNYSSNFNFDIDVTKMSAKAKVYMPNDATNEHLSYSTTLSFATGTNTDTFSIKVVPESGNSDARTYTVTVYKNSATLDSDTTLGNLTITGVKNGIYYDYIPASNATSEATPDPNSPTLIVGDVNLTFSVGLPTGSKASRNLSIKAPGDADYTALTLSQTTNSVQYTVQTSTTQDLVYYLEVYATAEDTTVGTKYYIKIVVPKTSDDTSSSVTSPDPSNTITDISGTDDKLIETKPGTTDAPINVTPNDPDATVAITTPNGSNLTFTPSGSNPGQGTIGGLKPGNNKVTVKVTAPNNDDTSYDIYIWVDETPDLDDLEVWDAVDTATQYQLSPIYQQTVFNYTVDIPYSVNSTILKYAFSSATDSSKLNVKYYIGSSSIANSFSSALEAIINTTNSVTIRVVVSQNYTAGYTPTSPIAAGTRTYEIEFKKASPSTDCELLTIDADGTPVPNGGTYVAGTEYVLDYARNTIFTNLTNITYNGKSITVTSSDTTITPLGNNNDAYRVTLVAGKAVTVTIMVNPEDPTAQPAIYKFVLVAANKDKDVTDLNLLDNNQTYVDVNGDSLQFNPQTTTPYSFLAKNSTNVLTLRITKPQYTTVSIDGVAKSDSYGQTTYDYTINLTNYVDPNDYEVTVQLLSEYYVAYGQNIANASDEYKIIIKRQALDNDATLSKLVVTIDGVAQTIFATRTPEGTFNIPNVGSATSINVEATPTKSTTKVNGSSANPYTNSFTLGGNTSNGYNYQIILSCVAEDGTPQNYVLEISRGPINASDDNGIILIEVLDSNNVYYIAQQGNAANNIQQFDQAQLPYTITMPYGATSYTINAQILQGSYAKLYITDGTGSNDVQTSSRQFQITSAMYGTTITHKVYAISDSGIPGVEYTITIKFEEPKVDNSLKSLTVDGDEQITATTPSNPTFTINRPNSVTTVDIAAIVNDPTATITSNSDLGHLSLAEGQNVFTVTVIAQDGTPQTYTIIVNRDYANPTLMDLGVTGETLLDYDTKKATTFDPDTKKYFVRVPYTKETADIYAYSSSINDVILGTGTKNLLVGDNKFTVKITSVHGTSTEYELHIYRLPEETMNASLDWLNVFQVGADNSNIMDGSDRLELKDENAKKISEVFNSDKIYYGIYNVNGKVGSLDVKYDTVVHGNEFYDSPDVQILGADKLHIGKNQVVILVTAPDGIHQKAYVIEVERDDIAYNVLEDQIESDGYTLEKVVDKLEYNINIGKKKTSEVDFLAYIEALNATGDNAEQELEITYKTNIENNPDDVIIEIATKDGLTKQVIFHVESTSNHNNANFWTFFPLLILLIIILIILIMILISVNKDKYGKITRKADKKSDKKEKAANK